MKRVLALLLIASCTQYALAQDVYTSSGKPGYHKQTKKKSKGYDPSRLILGGGLEAAFGGGYVNVGIAPIVGYRLTEHFSAGVGLGYLYFQAPEFSTGYKVYYFKENIVYPSIWTRYYVYRNFFVSGTVEYDIINRKEPGYDNLGNLTTINSNPTNTCLLLGAGLRQPLGGRASAYIELVYDVLQGPYSPYPQDAPDFRFGIGVGL